MIELRVVETYERDGCRVLLTKATLQFRPLLYPIKIASGDIVLREYDELPPWQDVSRVESSQEPHDDR